MENKLKKNGNKYALISVSDKTDLIKIAKAIIKQNYNIISTGGTYNLLKENNIDVIEISNFTGEKEILNGRIKSLGRNVHAGLLADKEKHLDEIEKFDIKLIDIVVCNFYPFEKKIKESVSLIKNNEKTEKELIPILIENIDIGGPTMVWSAIKNYKNKLIITDPSQYDEVIKELEKINLNTNSNLSPDVNSNSNQTFDKVFDEVFVKKLVSEASQKVSRYRMMIANFLNSKFFLEEKYSEEELPKFFNPCFEKIDYDFRYGENPHQNLSAGYKNILNQVNIFDAKILNAGKVPSYNNIADMNAAIAMLLDFLNYDRVDIIMKHGNPCGLGIGEDAFKLACETDQISRFGGIYITNKKLTLKDADMIGKKYFEVILAPGYETNVVEKLVEKDNRRRIFDINEIIKNYNKDELMINSVIGGIIVQNYNSKLYDKFEIVSNLKPNENEIKASELAFKIVKHCNSNAIVITNDKQAIGLGVGQMSRLDSVNIAIKKAEESGFNIDGCVLASDAFFPKSDGVFNAIAKGIKGIIQPGGSVNDEEIIDLINEKNKFMIFTNMRHFKHSR
jgi:phosphoribosylaminoimidazolecarboxamide formyltransferase / IMP cyclohydrolase